MSEEEAKPLSQEERLARIEGKLNFLIELLMPREVLDLFNVAVTGGNAFGSSTPSRSISAFRVYACFKAAGVLSAVRNKARDPNTKTTENLNGGSVLDAGVGYLFDILVTDDEQMAFQFSVSTVALSFKVYEVSAMVV